MLVPSIVGSPLRLEEVELGAAETFALAKDDHDALLFVHRGSCLLSLESESHRLEARTAGLVLAGESATVTAGRGGVSLVCALVGPGAERHAPLGGREVVARLSGREDAATGDRSFDLLFGPHNGSTRATLFMGYVPPGKAPWHYHLYDEIVWIPEGPARLHVDGRVEELGPRSGFRLRPREVHIVENPGAQVLEVLGIFTPAGTPSAAYLPVPHE